MAVNTALLLLLAPILSGAEKSVDILVPKLLRTIPFMNEETMKYDSGYKADQDEIPYIVALDFKGRRSTWFCAGSIIANRWILTAASCTNAARLVKISYGSTQRQQPLFQMRVSSNCFHAHPHFDEYFRNDIALIQTPYLLYSHGVRNVPLPKSQSLFTNTWPLSSGWGQHRGFNEVRNHLHVMQMEVLSNKNCSKLGYGRRIRREMLCGRMANTETSCHLDSGSPMVSETKPVLIGIGSFGNQKGCKSHTPLGFTRITSYMDWIDSVMANHG